MGPNACLDFTVVLKFHLLNKYLLSTYYMLGIVLDSRIEWSENQGQSLSYTVVNMLAMS